MAGAEMVFKSGISMPRKAGNFHEVPGEKNCKNTRNPPNITVTIKKMTVTVQNEQFGPFSARPGGNGSIDCHFRPGRAGNGFIDCISGPAGPKMGFLAGPEKVAFFVSEYFFWSIEFKIFRILRIE